MYSISGDAHSPMLIVVLVLEASPFKFVDFVAALHTTRCDLVRYFGGVVGTTVNVLMYVLYGGNMYRCFVCVSVFRICVVKAHE